MRTKNNKKQQKTKTKQQKTTKNNKKQGTVTKEDVGPKKVPFSECFFANLDN